MKILSIDTSVKTAAVSVAEAGESGIFVLSECASSGLVHSSGLLPMVDHCLKTADTPLAKIGLLAAVTGPGSFTGIRIGVSAVKGLGFSAGEEGFTPAAALSSLEVLALGFSGASLWSGGKTFVIPAIDARRGQVFAALFELTSGGEIIRLTPDSLVRADEFLRSVVTGGKNNLEARVIFAGDGADLCYNILEDVKSAVSPVRFPRAFGGAGRAMAAAAYAKFIGGETLSPARLSPSYLIKTEAERNFDDG